MSTTSKHRRYRRGRTSRWLERVRQLLSSIIAEDYRAKEASAGQQTMLPSGSLFSTLYAGSHPLDRIPPQRE
ncbi:hypothetical protein [Arthrobacter sp. SLBN-112]|uniref:hypothetical protein n=1 Tax=Arthrobacter sp. SLBN-112 TaxID=2768452 RepID=UPI0027B1619E|nr:hypothetical protein [Arthrobacter sp. SLBN-112]MDQ0801478.1 hypothetical protein [Arthrobacter sp. SLBN-112]